MTLNDLSLSFFKIPSRSVACLFFHCPILSLFLCSIKTLWGPGERKPHHTRRDVLRTAFDWKGTLFDGTCGYCVRGPGSPNWTSGGWRRDISVCCNWYRPLPRTTG